MQEPTRHKKSVFRIPEQMLFLCLVVVALLSVTNQEASYEAVHYNLPLPFM